MNSKHPCLYSVIRFLPYRETEEFANVGILLLSEKFNFLSYRLEISRHVRFTDFFLGLEARIFNEGVRNLDAELQDLLFKDSSTSADAPARANKDLKLLFDQLIRPRRTLFYFSAPRVLLAASPEHALEDLYSHYVDKRFAQKFEYQENIMRQTVGRILGELEIKNLYRSKKIGDDSYHIPVPFFHEGAKESKAIKPISFDLSDSTKIWHKGDLLIRGLERLGKQDLLPSRILLPIKHPQDGAKKEEASREICLELAKNAVAKLVDFNEVEKIKKFALIDIP